MRLIKSILAVLAAWPIAALTVPAAADVLIMRTGERFETSQLWEGENTYRFDLNGLVVRVHKSDVAGVIRAEAPEGRAPAPPQLPQRAGNARNDGPPPAEYAQVAPPKPPPQTPDSGKNASEPRQKAPSAPKPIISAQDTGLQGVAWQMNPSDLPGLEKVGNDDLLGGIDQYRLADIDFAFGRAGLDGMLFGFWRNRLYSITCWIAGRPGYEQLKDEVFATYGKGHKNRTGLERYVWQSRDSDRLLEFDDQLNSGIFWMRSRKLDTLIREINPQ
jgi:hypothetical protein